MQNWILCWIIKYNFEPWHATSRRQSLRATPSKQHSTQKLCVTVCYIAILNFCGCVFYELNNFLLLWAVAHPTSKVTELFRNLKKLQFFLCFSKFMWPCFALHTKIHSQSCEYYNLKYATFFETIDFNWVEFEMNNKCRWVFARGATKETVVHTAFLHKVLDAHRDFSFQKRCTAK